MIDVQVLQAQLRDINEDLPFWVHPEIKELPEIIVPNETIKHLSSGRYDGGIALLVATDQRLLVIDKKPLFLSVEDIRYDMIAEINYSHRLFNSVVHVNSFNKTIWFNSFNKRQLRQLSSYIQHRLSEMRQQPEQVAQPERTAVPVDTNFGLQVFDDNEITAGQAKAVLPYTMEAWEKVNERVNTVNSYGSSPMFRRPRVSKFTIPKYT